MLHGGGGEAFVEAGEALFGDEEADGVGGAGEAFGGFGVVDAGGLLDGLG